MASLLGRVWGNPKFSHQCVLSVNCICFNLSLNSIFTWDLCQCTTVPMERLLYFTRMIRSLNVIERRRAEESLQSLLSSAVNSSARQGFIFTTSVSPETHLLPQRPASLRPEAPSASYKCSVLSLRSRVQKWEQLHH